MSTVYLLRLLGRLDVEGVLISASHGEILHPFLRLTDHQVTVEERLGAGTQTADNGGAERHIGHKVAAV